ncbi:hypothetical protein RB195_000287 [Necator americanus]|uniref:Uncharacterized protein n=1 Tax=Necator americanus TaxID=51031 RepID=A0ABR1DAB7_NECAM
MCILLSMYYKKYRHCFYLKVELQQQHTPLQFVIGNVSTIEPKRPAEWYNCASGCARSVALGLLFTVVTNVSGRFFLAIA